MIKAKKQPKPDYSFAAKFCLFAPPIVGAMSIALALYYDYFNPEKDDKSTVNPADILLASAAVSVPLIFGSARDTCITFAHPHMYAPVPEEQKRKYGMALARTAGDVIYAKKLGFSVNYAEPESEFKNGMFHILVANHMYPNLFEIINSLTADEIKTIAAMQDANGRTPFSLSLVMAAPGEVQRALMTHQNVLIADKYQATPLMLAASGFTNPETTTELLMQIGDQLPKEYAKRDIHGNNLNDYAQKSKNAIKKMLVQLDINPKKAMNHCHNDFNSMSKTYMICVYNESTRDAMIKTGFDIGETVWSGTVKMYCVLATRNNLEKIIALADGKHPILKQKITEESYYAHGNYDDDNIAKRFESHKKTATKLLQTLSNTSVLDQIFLNREANTILIQEAMDKYLDSNTHSKKFK